LSGVTDEKFNKYYRAPCFEEAMPNYLKYAEAQKAEEDLERLEVPQDVQTEYGADEDQVLSEGAEYQVGDGDENGEEEEGVLT
jgi:hypothetical protein